MRWFVALNVVFMVLYIQVYTKMDNFVPAHLAQVRCTSNRLWTRPFVTLCVFQWTYTPSPIQQTHIWSYFDSFNTYSTHSCVSYRLGRIFIVRMWCAWVKYYKIFFNKYWHFFFTTLVLTIARIHEGLHIWALFEVPDAFGVCWKLHRTCGKVSVFQYYQDVDV